ncbi:MAG: L-threonylcarbamoyladenylate synthase [Porcipelethomonas sp.]
MENTVLLTASDEDIKYAAELIKQGKTVGIPTETVYGLGADALDPEAVKKIFAAKGRPCDNPLIVHIYDIETAQRLAHHIPDLFYRLAEKFWPGPLTMIVPKRSIVPDETSGGLETVGIRMPSHDIMRKIIRLAGPIAAPSANRSGYPSPTSAQHVMRDMNGIIPAVIDGGESRFGVESTVISFDDEKTVRILRPGSVTKRMLEEAADNVLIDEAILSDLQRGRAAPSPGMKYKHYSPKAKVIMVEGDFDAFCKAAEKYRGKKTYCLVFDGDDTEKLPCRYMTYGSSSSEQAHHVFSRLREADEMNAEVVLVRAPSKDGVGLAVYNRLLRAAGFEVIRV